MLHAALLLLLLQSFFFFSFFLTFFFISRKKKKIFTYLRARVVRNPVCGLTLGRMQLEESGRDAEDWAKFHAHFAIAIERDYVRKRVVPIRKTALLGEGAAVQASVNLLFFFFQHQ